MYVSMKKKSRGQGQGQGGGQPIRKGQARDPSLSSTLSILAKRTNVFGCGEPFIMVNDIDTLKIDAGTSKLV